jgi:Rho GDP-dissociation inhibitor
MADHPTEDELKPEATEGFKVGEKKTIDEYQQLGKTNQIHLASK